jgi:hypothetical protein
VQSSIEPLEVLKNFGPWLTGGLAGATLTYLLNQRIARRKRAKLQLTTERVDYSLASRDEQLKELRVSYRGNEFDNLVLYQFRIENVSTRTIPSTPFLLRLASGTAVVDRRWLTHPLARDTVFNQQPGHECAYLWDAGELKPQDSAELKLLLAPTTPVDWSWRGDDEVEVIGFGRENVQTVERQLRAVLIWISFYLAFSGLWPFSGIFQAVILAASIPSIVSFCIRWWPVCTENLSAGVAVMKSAQDGA